MTVSVADDGLQITGNGGSKNMLPSNIPQPNSSVTVIRHDEAISVVDKLTDVGIFSGSFNPLHDGHLKLRATAAELLKRDVVFELSISNVAKKTLTDAVVAQRVSQFQHTVAITDAPRFHQKSDLFPGCCFVVGYDTAIRIVDPRFYKKSTQQMFQSLRAMRSNGNAFLVAGRIDATDVFRGMGDLAIPTEFSDLFTEIPEELFREDISSTQLRRADL